ncbi:MAG TPA: hypothetical protein VF678_06545, partial [bacterium]
MSWLESGTRSNVVQTTGTAAGTAAEHGEFGATFAPDAALTASATTYCMDWGQAQTTLPFGAIDTALPGVTATELTYHASATSDLGVVIAGADALRRDRVILYSSATQVVAIQADLDFPNGIFRALPADPFPQSDTLSGRTLVRMPEAIFQSRHTGTSTGDSLDKVLLGITAGVDVTFSGIPGSATGTCAFVLYQDTSFVTPVFPAPLTFNASSQTLAINPADPGWPFATTVVGSTTVYLVPVETQSPANGDCEALIRSAPIVERVARNHLATPAAGAIFRSGLPEGTNLLAGGRALLPQQLEYLTLTRGALPLEPFVLNGTMNTITAVSPMQTPAALLDPLHLKGATREPAMLSVSGRALSVFPSVAAKLGWGPFTPENRIKGASVAVPVDVPISVSNAGARTHFTLSVTTPQRIALWTDGGVT